MATAVWYEAETAGDAGPAQPPKPVRPSYEGALSSVRLVEFFSVPSTVAVQPAAEWVDDAPMVLPSRGRTRVKVVAVRRLTFSAVGDEFGSDDD